jgi:hypothetical protein
MTSSYLILPEHLTVSHSIVIEKLKRLGIAEQPWKWIANFLSNRTQALLYDGALSDEASVTSGVIQGSSIGPLLFVAFINDLPDVVAHSDLLMFADDSKAEERLIMISSMTTFNLISTP